ncbi:hypothetical protein BYT27DRAFT_7240637, partial [Phlegmacium glaucopus]
MKMGKRMQPFSFLLTINFPPNFHLRYLSTHIALLYFFTTSFLHTKTASSLSPSLSISTRMAGPSSSQHGERYHRSKRKHEQSHHHNQTISSTTLLLHRSETQ